MVEFFQYRTAVPIRHREPVMPLRSTFADRFRSCEGQSSLEFFLRSKLLPLKAKLSKRKRLTFFETLLRPSYGVDSQASVSVQVHSLSGSSYIHLPLPRTLMLRLGQMERRRHRARRSLTKNRLPPSTIYTFRIQRCTMGVEDDQ